MIAGRLFGDFMCMEIILASKSPRRYEISSAHGVTPIVIPPRVSEELPPEIDGGDPEAVVKYLSRIKAMDVIERIAGGAPYGGNSHHTSDAALAGDVDSCCGREDLPRLLISADTIVYCDRIIGKPVDEQDSFRILSSYRNRSHEVWTGVTIIDRNTGEDDTFAVCTRVTLGDFSDEEIWQYIKEEQPFDKSGSYAIQSSWGKHVTSIEGDYENIIGFPWPVIEEHLEKIQDN
jgi:septum formation protein